MTPLRVVPLAMLAIGLACAAAGAAPAPAAGATTVPAAVFGTSAGATTVPAAVFGASAGTTTVPAAEFGASAGTTTVPAAEFGAFADAVTEPAAAFGAMPPEFGRGGDADPPDSGLSARLTASQLEAIDTGAIETYWNGLMRDYGGFFPDRHVPSFMEMIMPGGEGLDFRAAMSGLVRFALHEVIYSGRLIGTIVLLTVFCMILETIQSAFERSAVSKAAYAVAYMVLLVLAANSFGAAIGYAQDAIGGMVQFMMAMIPLLLTLLASMGNVITVTVMHPLIVFMIHAVSVLIHTLVFPLLFFSAVLHIASALSDRFKATQLAGLLRSTGVAVLGVLLTVFLGVITVQGATGSVADGVALRTAKFVTGNFVPVVGRMFSDAADTVLSASIIVKNAIGIAGVVILLFLCLFPAVKILALAVIYRLSAAVLQPLGSSPVVTCLETIGKTMIYVFAAVAAVGMMFFLAVTIILAAGNAALMIR